MAVSSRSAERIEAAAAEIGARPYVHDSADLDAAPRLIDGVEADLGPLAVLVTNTGGPPGGEPLEFSREQWEAAYRELVLAPMALIEYAVPGMRERGFGRILNVSSSAVREPIPALLLSTAHRSALLATFKLLSRRLADDGITLNTVLPGRIATDRLKETTGRWTRPRRPPADEVPIGRLGTIEEIGAAARVPLLGAGELHHRRGARGGRRADAGDLMLGLPDGIRACLFDLDGVLTQTAKVHAAAWKQMFDEFLQSRAGALPRVHPTRLQGVRRRQAAHGRRAVVPRRRAGSSCRRARPTTADRETSRAWATARTISSRA